MLLLAYQLAVAVPFLLSGLVISLALRTAARRVDRLASIFPYEADLYASTPLRVDYVGFPAAC